MLLGVNDAQRGTLIVLLLTKSKLHLICSYLCQEQVYLPFNYLPCPFAEDLWACLVFAKNSSVISNCRERQNLQQQNMLKTKE